MMIELESVCFGVSVSDPTPSQRIVTQFHAKEGMKLMFNAVAGLLFVEKDGHKKIYPVTNIKEMRPMAREMGSELPPEKKRGRAYKVVPAVE